jgi:hypothetical protein
LWLQYQLLGAFSKKARQKPNAFSKKRAKNLRAAKTKCFFKKSAPKTKGP